MIRLRRFRMSKLPSSRRACFIICSSFVLLYFVSALVSSYWKDYVIAQEFKEYHKLNTKVLEEIAKYAQRRKHRKNMNFSVLMDQYYTVPLNYAGNRNPAGISCSETNASGFVKYSLCYYSMDGLCRTALEKGIWQMRATGLIIRALQRSPGAAFIDIGANIGLMALPIMAAIGSNLKIIAVEANERNVQSLIRGIVENQFPTKNWAVIHRALSNTVDVQTEFVLDANEETMGVLGTVDFPKTLFKGQRVKATTATFDSHVLRVAQAMNVTAAVMKVDIEGSECVAMQAAKRLFTEINIFYVVVEVGPPNENQLQNHTCLEIMFSVLEEFAFVPFKPDSIGVEGMLDTRTYRNWPFIDVIWKKIL